MVKDKLGKVSNYEPLLELQTHNLLVRFTRKSGTIYL